MGAEAWRAGDTVECALSRRSRPPRKSLDPRSSLVKIAVIGLGYVGLPLAMVFAEAGVEVVGIEAVASRCDEINAGRSYIQDVAERRPEAHGGQGPRARHHRLRRDRGLRRRHHLPAHAAERQSRAGPHARQGRHTTGSPATCAAASSSPWRAPPIPGTTRDELAPILEAGSGLIAGVDFHLAFSPERVDPGRTDYTTKTTPKVRRRPHPGLHGAGASRSTGARSTTSCRSARPRSRR